MGKTGTCPRKGVQGVYLRTCGFPSMFQVPRDVNYFSAIGTAFGDKSLKFKLVAEIGDLHGDGWMVASMLRRVFARSNAEKVLEDLAE